MTNTPAIQTGTLKKVLVVEDQSETGLLLNLILDDKEIQFDYVKDLLSADEYLEKQTPQVIVLDNKLPDGFGVDFIIYLKRKYPSIRIIMISGYSSARDVAMENGADAFLEKPFTAEEFNSAIKSLLP